MKNITNLVGGVLVLCIMLTGSLYGQFTTLWERANDEQPEWFGTGTERSIAFGIIDDEELLLVASRGDGQFIRLIDPETGDDVGEIDASGLTGGTIPFNTVAVSDDGKIFASNLAAPASADDPFKVYMWEDMNAAEELVVTYTEEEYRLVDNLTVAGSVEDGTAVIYGAVGNDNRVLRWSMIEDNENSGNYVFDQTPDDLELSNIAAWGTPGSAVGKSHDIDDGFFATGRSVTFIREYDGDGTTTGYVEYADGNKNAGAIDYHIVDDTEVMFSYHPGIRQVRVHTLAGDPGSVWTNRTGEDLGATPVLGTTQEAISGDLAVKNYENGMFIIYKLATNNGIAAYEADFTLMPGGTQLAGVNAVPPAITPATGEIQGTISGAKSELILEGSFSGLLGEFTAAHLHIAPVGETGPPVIELSVTLENDTAGTFLAEENVFELTEEQFFALNTGELYVNIHSDAYPAGELRGHLYGVDNEPPTASNIVEPEDGTALTIEGNPSDVFTIEWEEAEDPDGDQFVYLLNVALDEDFEQPLVLDLEGTYTSAHPMYAEVDAFLNALGVDVDESIELYFRIITTDGSQYSIGDHVMVEFTRGTFDELAGEFYIPQGDHDRGFESLYDGLVALHTAGVAGEVIFLIDDDLDERWDDLEITYPGFTEDNSFTIKPAAGKTPTIVFNGTFYIEGADYITIDGSNNDSDERHLTFLYDDAGAAAFWIAGNSHYITLKNTIILNTFDDPATYGSGGVRVRRDDAATVRPTNVVISNCQVGSVDNPFKDGMQMWGTGSPILRVQADAIDNDIYAAHRGITTFYMEESIYGGNTIHITGQHEAPAWYAGVYLAGGDNMQVINNDIRLLGANDPGGSYVAGVNINLNAGYNDIYNNFITATEDFINYGGTDDNMIFAVATHREGAGEEYNIYHNSVNLFETGQTGASAAIGWIGQTATGAEFEMINNIFINHRNAENAYAIYWPLSTVPVSDYNNLYTPGENANVGYFDDDVFATVGDWQFGADLDHNSVSIDVLFESAVDLRLTGDSVGDERLAGIPLELVETDIDGNVRDINAPYMGAYEAPVSLTTDDIADDRLPREFQLHQNYPNPFNPSTTIQFAIPEQVNVRLEVYNMLGQRVNVLLADETLQPGIHSVVWHGVNDHNVPVSSGTYIYRIVAGDFVESKQMIFLK